MAVDPTQMPVPNTAQKRDVGVMPDPLSSAFNAFLTQLTGTNYGMNQAATSYAPPRGVGGNMPGGMMMDVAPQPPTPEMNPAFHTQSPLEYDLASLLRSGGPATSVPASMMAMGEEPDNPETPPTPGVPAIKPPLPTKKPLPAKPEKTQSKGGPSTEPKRVAPPPSRKRAVAEK